MNKVILKVLLSLLLLPAMIWLFKVGAGDFLCLRPVAYVEAVKSGALPLEVGELLNNRKRLYLARHFDNSNAMASEYLALTAFMLAHLARHNPGLQGVFLREALTDLHSATLLQPYSAYLSVASLQAESSTLQCNEQDTRQYDAMQMSLRRADWLAPWNPLILGELLRLGNMHYCTLSVADRLVVKHAVERAAQLRMKTN